MLVVPEHRSVVVGVDGSPNSMVALRRAAREALDRRARLDVVRVLAPGDAVPAARPLRTLKEWLWLRGVVAKAVPRTQHLTTRLRVLHGEPGPTLVEAAAKAELLVVGARLRSEFGNPLGGDTVPVVRKHARCGTVICADHSPAARQDP